MMKDNIEDIEARIQAACKRAGRERSEVTLIAVSKTKPNSMILEAYSLGMRHFGENKVQELAGKYDELKSEFDEEVFWHQIGHLQRNKVKYIVGKTILIHSVDSLRLAVQIEEEAAKRNIICDILIEVNIAKEDTKFGVLEEDVLPLLLEITKLKHIRVRGLMTIAPYVENQEENRTYFRKLCELNIDIKSKNIDNVFKGFKPSLEDNSSLKDDTSLENNSSLKDDTSLENNLSLKDNSSLENNSSLKDNSSLENNSSLGYNSNLGYNSSNTSTENNSSISLDILSMGMTGDFEVAIEEGATMIRVGTGIFGERNYN